MTKDKGNGAARPRQCHTVLVTGGASGIGKFIVQALLQHDYTVAIVDNALCDEQAFASLAKFPNQVGAWEADVGDYESVSRVVSEIVGRWGRIDALVNNAGLIVIDEFLEIPIRRFEQVIQTNLLGPFYLCRAVVPQMLKQRYGRIVNMSSRNGLDDFGARRTAYGASKAGLVCFSQALAADLRGTGISVNVACPPNVRTPDHSPTSYGRALNVETLVAVVLDLVHPHCQATGTIFPVYSAPSFIRAAFRDVRKYAQWLPQLKYRVRPGS